MIRAAHAFETITGEFEETLGAPAIIKARPTFAYIAYGAGVGMYGMKTLWLEDGTVEDTLASLGADTSGAVVTEDTNYFVRSTPAGALFWHRFDEETGVINASYTNLGHELAYSSSVATRGDIVLAINSTNNELLVYRGFSAVGVEEATVEHINLLTVCAYEDAVLWQAIRITPDESKAVLVYTAGEGNVTLAIVDLDDEAHPCSYHVEGETGMTALPTQTVVTNNHIIVPVIGVLPVTPLKEFDMDGNLDATRELAFGSGILSPRNTATFLALTTSTTIMAVTTNDIDTETLYVTTDVADVVAHRIVNPTALLVISETAFSIYDVSALEVAEEDEETAAPGATMTSTDLTYPGIVIMSIAGALVGSMMAAGIAAGALRL